MKYISGEILKTTIFDYTPGNHKNLVEKPTIIKFTAEWCGPCKMINPILEDIEKEFEGKIDIFNIDVDKEHVCAASFGIQSIPNMIFFPVQGAPERMVGALPKKVIVEAIKRVFKI